MMDSAAIASLAGQPQAVDLQDLPTASLIANSTSDLPIAHATPPLVGRTPRYVMHVVLESEKCAHGAFLTTRMFERQACWWAGACTRLCEKCSSS